MIKTLSPYPNPAKTAEIMSRYRPIAPKPETTSTSMNEGSTSQKINKSPYLRSLWSQLQARPTRTRKRGRASLLALPSSLKRQKNHLLGLCPPCHVTSPPKSLSFRTFPSLPQLHFPPPNHGLGMLNTATNQNLVTLPLLPCTPEQCPAPKFDSTKEVVAIDLNATAENIPEERDLLQQLQRPVCKKVIAPQPIRPIGSCINVGCITCISEYSTALAPLPAAMKEVKRKHEVEEEVESETLPAVISDSNNRVRMANSAYKEMVDQPECAWLESMVSGGTDGKVVQCSKRISGEVALNLCDSSVVPISSNGFSCWVRIEWETEQKKKVSINAFCDVLRLSCECRDYLFTWRFHTHGGEAFQSSCSV